MSLIKFFALLMTIPSLAHAVERLTLGKNGEAALEMSTDNNSGETTVKVRLPSGKSQKLTDQFVPFDFEGTTAAIAIVDLDNDGSEEFVLRGMIPPISGGLYLYRYNDKAKKFVPVVTGADAEDDYLPVDAVAPVRFDRSGRVHVRVIVRGQERQATEDREFKYVNGKFKRVR